MAKTKVGQTATHEIWFDDELNRTYEVPLEKPVEKEEHEEAVQMIAESEEIAMQAQQSMEQTFPPSNPAINSLPPRIRGALVGAGTEAAANAPFVAGTGGAALPAAGVATALGGAIGFAFPPEEQEKDLVVRALSQSWGMDIGRELGYKKLVRMLPGFRQLGKYSQVAMETAAGMAGAYAGDQGVIRAGLTEDDYSQLSSVLAAGVPGMFGGTISFGRAAMSDVGEASLISSINRLSRFLPEKPETAEEAADSFQQYLRGDDSVKWAREGGKTGIFQFAVDASLSNEEKAARLSMMMKKRFMDHLFPSELKAPEAREEFREAFEGMYSEIRRAKVVNLRKDVSKVIDDPSAPGETIEIKESQVVGTKIKSKWSSEQKALFKSIMKDLQREPNAPRAIDLDQVLRNVNEKIQRSPRLSVEVLDLFKVLGEETGNSDAYHLIKNEFVRQQIARRAHKVEPRFEGHPSKALENPDGGPPFRVVGTNFSKAVEDMVPHMEKHFDRNQIKALREMAEIYQSYDPFSDTQIERNIIDENKSFAMKRLAFTLTWAGGGAAIGASGGPVGGAVGAAVGAAAVAPTVNFINFSMGQMANFALDNPRAAIATARFLREGSQSSVEKATIIMLDHFLIHEKKRDTRIPLKPSTPSFDFIPGF